MKYLLLTVALAAALFVHYMDWAEGNCLELGNTAEECAKL